MPGHLHDWIAETPESIAARLQGAQEAQRQTRFTLGMMTVISMMMLILSYNAYLSFDSRWITQLAEAHRTIESLETKIPVEDLLTHQALQDWANARNATIELLGIRVSVDDAPILGTTSLFMFAMWLVLVTRRENHTIGSLLRDTDTPRRDGDTGVPDGAPPAVDEPDLYSNGQRWLIFHTIAASNLFVTFDRSMSRIQSLRGTNVLMSKAEGVKGLPGRLGLAFARDFFFLFPVAASLFVFYLDRLSYFRRIHLCQGPNRWAPTRRSISSQWSCSSRAGLPCSYLPLLQSGIREGPTPSSAIMASDYRQICYEETRGQLEWAPESGRLSPRRSGWFAADDNAR